MALSRALVSLPASMQTAFVIEIHLTSAQFRRYAHTRARHRYILVLVDSTSFCYVRKEVKAERRCGCSPAEMRPFLSVWTAFFLFSRGYVDSSCVVAGKTPFLRRPPGLLHFSSGEN